MIHTLRGPKSNLGIQFYHDLLLKENLHAIKRFEGFFLSILISGGDAQATLGDVLAFATAADVPPTLGFDTIPTISFTDTAFPTANTCSTTLRLPTIYESYDDFKEKMDYSILNSPCFGQK